MAKNRLTLDELGECLRRNNILNVEQVKYAILETNGQLSTFLYPQFSPLTAKDAGKKPQETEYPVTIISCGRIMQQNLQAIGKDEEWLRQQLFQAKLTQNDVFFLTATGSGQVHIVKKEETT